MVSKSEVRLTFLAFLSDKKLRLSIGRRICQFEGSQHSIFRFRNKSLLLINAILILVGEIYGEQ